MARPLIETNSGPYRLALATSVCTVLLLMAGALVTNNDAGDSVPDWPLAYGRLIPPLIGGIRFEYTHRVIAGIVAILTLVLAIWLTFAKLQRRPTATLFGWTALALVLAQAGLGALRVYEVHPMLSATAHATLAQVFFITVVGLALYLSPWWETGESIQDSKSPSLLTLTALTTVAILAQLILGAAFRHGAFGIEPHLIGAGVVTIMVVSAGRAAKKRFRENIYLRRCTILLHSCFGLQILLGFAAWYAVRVIAPESPQPTVAFVTLTVAHVLGGALTLAASMLLTMVCYRLAPAPYVPAGFSAKARV